MNTEQEIKNDEVKVVFNSTFIIPCSIFPARPAGGDI